MEQNQIEIDTEAPSQGLFPGITVSLKKTFLEYKSVGDESPVRDPRVIKSAIASFFSGPGPQFDDLDEVDKSGSSANAVEFSDQKIEANSTAIDVDDGNDFTKNGMSIKSDITPQCSLHDIPLSSLEENDSAGHAGEEDGVECLDLMRSVTVSGSMEEDVNTVCAESDGNVYDTKGGASEHTEHMQMKVQQLEKNISISPEKHSEACSFENSLPNSIQECEEGSLNGTRSEMAPGDTEENQITRSDSIGKQDDKSDAIVRCLSMGSSIVEEDIQLDEVCKWYPGPGLVDNCLPGPPGVSSILRLRPEGCRLEVKQWVLDKKFDHQRSRLQRKCSGPFNVSLPGFEEKLEVVMRGVNAENPIKSAKFSQTEGRRLILRQYLEKDDAGQARPSISPPIDIFADVQFRVGAGRGMWSEAATQVTTAIDADRGEVREACFDHGFPDIGKGPLVIQVAIRLEEC